MSTDQNILVKLNDAGLQLNNKWLVKGVSLQVEKGKIVTLMDLTDQVKVLQQKLP